MPALLSACLPFLQNKFLFSCLVVISTTSFRHTSVDSRSFYYSPISIPVPQLNSLELRNDQECANHVGPEREECNQLGSIHDLCQE
jgi:hypothetical protein